MSGGDERGGRFGSLQAGRDAGLGQAFWVALPDVAGGGSAGGSDLLMLPATLVSFFFFGQGHGNAESEKQFAELLRFKVRSLANVAL